MKEKNEYCLWKSILWAVLTLVLALVLLFAGGTLGGWLTSFMLASDNDAIVFGQTYACFIGIWLLFPAVSLIGKENRKSLEVLKPCLSRWKTSLILGLLVGFGLNLLIGLIAAARGEISLHYDHFEPLMFLLLIFCVAIQSGAEELAMRWFV